MTARVDVTAMCLTCATTRPARAEHGGSWIRLCRPVLQCKTCGCQRDHAVADKQPDYGHDEDGLRIFCSRTSHLIAELSAMPDVDLRWFEGRWCLGHGGAFEVSLDWLSEHPGEELPCICEEQPEIGRGAQPAGWAIEREDGGWLVELDIRQPRERLAGPLRRLRRDLLAGDLTESVYLDPAYNVGWEVGKVGERIAARRGQEAQ